MVGDSWRLEMVGARWGYAGRSGGGARKAPKCYVYNDFGASGTSQINETLRIFPDVSLEIIPAKHPNRVDLETWGMLKGG